MCTDQEAVDLVRHTHDPQLASKQLVEHALARFSTDNLSCMIVRFNGKVVQQTVERKIEPIGVEGDPPSTKRGGISEADAIVQEARKSMDDSGFGGGDKDESPTSARTDLSQQTIEEERGKEAGPELDPEAAKKMAGLKQIP